MMVMEGGPNTSWNLGKIPKRSILFGKFITTPIIHEINFDLNLTSKDIFL